MKEDEACCKARFETLDDFELDLVQNHPSIVQSLWEVEKQRMQQYLDAQKELKRDIPLELPSGEKREAMLRKLVEKRRRREEEQRTTENASTGDSGNLAILGKEARGVYSSSGSIRQRRVLERVQRQTVLCRTREEVMRGPLSLLSRCVKQRLRLRVDLRGPVGLRSTLHCFVVAFDRHWNLCLRDVDERFFSPKRQPAFLASTAEQQDVTPKCLFYKNEAGSKSKLGRRKRILRRHLNQLFIKGDNVIIIALLQAGSCSSDER